jgi:hypothetical protein
MCTVEECSLPVHPDYHLLQSFDVLGILDYFESSSIRSTRQRTNGQLLPVLPQLLNLSDCGVTRRAEFRFLGFRYQKINSVVASSCSRSISKRISARTLITHLPVHLLLSRQVFRGRHREVAPARPARWARRLPRPSASSPGGRPLNDTDSISERHNSHARADLPARIERVAEPYARLRRTQLRYQHAALSMLLAKQSYMTPSLAPTIASKCAVAPPHCG